MDQPQQFNLITTRAIIGMFFLQLEQFTGQMWIDAVSNTFESNQATETYAGLGMVPQLREWIGGKQENSFNELSVSISNRDFEATLAIKNKDRRRDKTGQVMARIGDLAQRAIAHDALLLSAIINGGTSTSIAIPGGRSATVACYDGQPLFSTSHLIGKTAISNSITTSLGALGTALGGSIGVGSTTNPTPAAMSAAIQGAVAQMYGFQDDQGQPLNEFARKFVVMVPPQWSGAAQTAVSKDFLALGFNNPLLSTMAPSLDKIEFTVVPNPRLTWTNQFAVFRADAPFKALIRQVEALDKNSDEEPEFGEKGLPVGYGLVMKALAEGSDHEFKKGEALFSVEKSGFVGCGRFEQCVLNEFVS